MIFAGNEPIGRFIALANLNKDLISQNSIEQDVENLVDLIKIRINDKSIDNVANGLLSKIFDLRFDLIKWLANNDKSLSGYLDTVNNHISINLQLAPYSDLAKAISTVLLSYEQIISPILESLPDSLEEILEGTQKNKPEYDTFKLFALHPSPRMKYLKNWLDASLQLDVGIILADLILTEQIKFSKRRIKSELIHFLLDTITRFGAYSIFTGFWVPNKNDLSNQTNKMKIFAAAIELDNKIFYKTSKEGLFNIINN